MRGYSMPAWTTLIVVLVLSVFPAFHRAQDKRGGVEKKQPPPADTAPKPATPQRDRSPKQPGPRRCEYVSFVVSCGVPNCEISLDGEPPKIAGANGESEFRAEAGPHRVRITKAGYDSLEDLTVVPTCQKPGPFRFPIKPLQSLLRIRTQPAEAEISINSNPQGKSDAQGAFTIQTSLPTL